MFPQQRWPHALAVLLCLKSYGSGKGNTLWLWRLQWHCALLPKLWKWNLVLEGVAAGQVRFAAGVVATHCSTNVLIVALGEEWLLGHQVQLPSTIDKDSLFPYFVIMIFKSVWEYLQLSTLYHFCPSFEQQVSAKSHSWRLPSRLIKTIEFF